MTEGKSALGSLWVSGRLNWLAVTCLKSAARTGHPVHLYTYGDVPNVPRGVVHLDAGTVVPKAELFRFDGISQPKMIGSYGPFSDVFRWRLLALDRGLWFDTDMYFLNSPDMTRDYLMCWEGPRDEKPRQVKVSSAFLKAPAASPLVRALTDLATPPHEMPAWVGDDYRRKTAEKLAGRPFFPGAVAYATFGPVALSYHVRRLALQKSVQPFTAYCPVSYLDTHRFGEPDAAFRASLGKNTKAVHIWNSNFDEAFGQRQPAGSFAARLREESLDA